MKVATAATATAAVIPICTAARITNGTSSDSDAVTRGIFTDNRDATAAAQRMAAKCAAFCVLYWLAAKPTTASPQSNTAVTYDLVRIVDVFDIFCSLFIYRADLLTHPTAPSDFPR